MADSDWLAAAFEGRITAIDVIADPDRLRRLRPGDSQKSGKSGRIVDPAGRRRPS